MANKRKVSKAAPENDATKADDDAKRYLQASEMVTTPAVQNAVAIESWGSIYGKQDLPALIKGLVDTTRKVNVDGNLLGPEAMLFGQAMALQTIFTNLARRAAINVGEYMGATETYLRLALKAQAQCRATLETLHEMKNPRPVAFVKQANIAHGPQQINNGPAPESEQNARARAGDSVSQPNELIEGHTHGGAQLDTRTTTAAGRKD